VRQLNLPLAQVDQNEVGHQVQRAASGGVSHVADRDKDADSSHSQRHAETDESIAQERFDALAVERGRDEEGRDQEERAMKNAALTEKNGPRMAVRSASKIGQRPPVGP
jgi:hypothetical protein